MQEGKGFGVGPHPSVSAPMSSPEFQFVTGWDRRLKLLLGNGLLGVAWSLALLLFALGKVSISHTLSEVGKKHLAIVSVLITGVATLATTHTKTSFQKIIRPYAETLLVEGITLRQMTWLQAIREWSFFDILSFESTKKRIIWFCMVLFMAAHSASVAAILQPQDFSVKHPNHDLLIPCGAKLDQIDLNGYVKDLPAEVSDVIDDTSYGIGLQLGSYYGTPSTSVIHSRTYLKGNISYAWVYGQGELTTPAAEIDLRCNYDGKITTQEVWAHAFPGETAPSLGTSDGPTAGLMNAEVSNFPAADFPRREVISSPSNMTKSGVYPHQRMSFISSVKSDGSGAFVSLQNLVLVSAEDPSAQTRGSFACSWKWTPKLMRIRNREPILLYETSDLLPKTLPRSLMFTLKGMSEAATLGANMLNDRGDGLFDKIYTTDPYTGPPSISQMLRHLLVDGSRGSQAGVAAYLAYSVQVSTNGTTSIPLCSSLHDLLAPHWKFGNERNLGWLAILLTFIAGVLDIMFAMKLAKRRRIYGIEAMKLVDAFQLGSRVDGPLPEMHTKFCFRDGRIVPAGEGTIALHSPGIDKEQFDPTSLNWRS